jgi:hypothetical protein
MTRGGYGYVRPAGSSPGARVITTCSAANADYVKSLGADQVIDYNKEDFTKVVKDCDAVFDTVGGEVAKNAFKVPRRLHQRPGTDTAQRGLCITEARRHPQARTPRPHRATRDFRCGEAAADHHLCADGCAGGAQGERGQAFAGEVGVQGARLKFQ